MWCPNTEFLKLLLMYEVLFHSPKRVAQGKLDQMRKETEKGQMRTFSKQGFDEHIYATSHASKLYIHES